MAGPQLGKHQETQERVSVKRRGRYVQLKITNTQGRIRVKNVSMGAVSGRAKTGTVA